ncbi:MAG: TIGR00730 family Rossman fold protein, partial [Bacteroidales bacterium]|nr:TIGR00730 family Rossman fold protein [Bacteroidales bacterium]
MRISVYCASSSKINQKYFDATRQLASELANRGDIIVYGGGSHGLMGCLADTALMNGGMVVGILPRFMNKVEWGHKN